ncbi:MAG: YciI family protein [Gammaproteobacteria bacterium]|nr:YciI family protein [Gammaproteobacteria bacterium]MCP5426107.1 YciI family protein [Gammaproteobacteria bacterium]MCP5459998.1 YciI family protein [Gammaproteobacteria bacterium]
MHYLLFYDYDHDYLERRAQFRTEHLTLAWQAQERGELILAGALADPYDSAVLVFKADSPAVVEAFAAADPYVINKLVTQWCVRPWDTVVGADAENPMRP